MLDLYFAERPLLTNQCCDALVSDLAIADLFPPADIERLRCDIAVLVALNGHSLPLMPPTEPASKARCCTHGLHGQVIQQLTPLNG